MRLIIAPMDVLMSVQIGMIQAMSNEDFDTWISNISTCEVCC